MTTSHAGGMADQLIEEQISEFKEVFGLFAKEKDGRLSLHELGAMLTALGHNPTQEDLDAMIQGVVPDEEGRLDFLSFLSIMAQKIKASDTEDELIESFKVFDRNGDGFINPDELRTSMMNLGEKLLDAEVQDMIDEADLDRDGFINYDEFVKMMMAK
eukprot:CAMPEP_0194505896 /NCGR_PEP_ID=MMETSP0253-20130528/33089_1 /TAXON_ID=2966 /ORGANISM="Noctiluca scintillans" /LENGTH=157 /DNA_ID=CAMNT_0039348519 /DNA_START=60 /DNA_END=533 /DNA_ORIENTATION=-